MTSLSVIKYSNFILIVIVSMAVRFHIVTLFFKTVQNISSLQINLLAISHFYVSIDYLILSNVNIEQNIMLVHNLIMPECICFLDIYVCGILFLVIFVFQI